MASTFLSAGPKNIESAQESVSHGVWKQTGSIPSSSAMVWSADVSQLLNFLPISVTPSIKIEQYSSLQGCCENEMRARFQNSDNWWGLFLCSGPCFASICSVILGKSPTLSGSPLLSLYSDVRCSLVWLWGSLATPSVFSVLSVVPLLRDRLGG